MLKSIVALRHVKTDQACHSGSTRLCAHAQIEDLRDDDTVSPASPAMRGDKSADLAWCALLAVALFSVAEYAICARIYPAKHERAAHRKAAYAMQW